MIVYGFVYFSNELHSGFEIKVKSIQQLHHVAEFGFIDYFVILFRSDLERQQYPVSNYIVFIVQKFSTFIQNLLINEILFLFNPEQFLKLLELLIHQFEKHLRYQFKFFRFFMLAFICFLQLF